VLNEVVIHRGHNLNPCIVQSYINDKHFATSRGDGLIAATPTGSTGYNLSAMGPMVQPSLRCINFTPICTNVPLSFRPLILPAHNVTIQMEILDARRGLTEDSQDTTLGNGHDVGIAAFDSVHSVMLRQHDIVTVKESPVPVITFDRVSALSDWIDHINKRASFTPPNLD
jgi:NAD+ kinase